MLANSGNGDSVSDYILVWYDRYVVSLVGVRLHFGVFFLFAIPLNSGVIMSSVSELSLLK